MFVACSLNAIDCDLCPIDCTCFYFRNPNAPHRQMYLTRSDLEWPEYDVSNQTYLSLSK
jgi:hypothetical protein